ncbi:MAG: FHA domain-containing protein [Polyangiaceae bacterium]
MRFALAAHMSSSPIPDYGRTRSFEAPTPREAFALARGLERARQPQATPGHRLYWMTSDSFGSCEIAAAGAAVVVGSHPLCHVHLLDEVGVALRHLLIRSSLVDDGCPVLSVLDLHTPHGFFLSNGSAERSIDATGAVVIRVGGYAIVALPSGATISEDMPAPVVSAMPESPYRIAGMSPEFLARPVNGASRITLLPHVVQVSETTSSVRNGEPDIYEIKMSSAMGVRAVRVAASDLRRGILIGRSLNCDPLLRTIVDMGISRGHLLFLKDRHRDIAYDLASTQGTYFFGRSSRSVTLADAGTTMMIGAAQRITIAWRRIS